MKKRYLLIIFITLLIAGAAIWAVPNVRVFFNQQGTLQHQRFLALPYWNRGNPDSHAPISHAQLRIPNTSLAWPQTPLKE